MVNRNPRSEYSVHSRASQQSTPSTGSQVSDGSIEAGHSVFHAMDDLIEEHLKEVFPKPSLMTDECHENLVVLYDDMKLAFNGLMSQVLVARGSEEAYTELTLQMSEFSYRLDQCMGLEPDEADAGYASTQEEDRTWPSQLTHDKNNGDKTGLNVPEPAAPEIGSLFTCECCPKKPKKFDNADDLRAHEMVKRYSCPFCNYRFKYKNEAERHQNSPHLRQTFQAVFDASISPSYQTNVGASHDVCGYCGEEFPNFPQADWDRRFEHLTTIHKFGECSNMRKFHRVDHFRQHLKYSHAGTNGKWTNILETACMKEEQPPKPQGDNTGASAGASSGSVSLTYSPVSSYPIWEDPQ
ncbi:hypothetical protein N7449_006705 [Penicillium cf. viridicatum]|uniref:C2H2-type domain-containing protein n=1 Tax=Penicillium cf. viridicatum TaxID=2972119 RepID=A0A9W9MAT3_9EURO|nr:hypothetical protein N7449_006705 [Penicillium cf. viridicatum]